MLDARKKILDEKRVIDKHIQNIKDEIMSTMKRQGVSDVKFKDMIISTDITMKKGNRTKKDFESKLRRYFENDLNLPDASRIINSINSLRKTDDEREVESLKLVKVKNNKRTKI